MRSWHFDETEFSVTLMLSAAEAGGEFDFAPCVRERAGRVGGEGELARVGELMGGGSEGLQRLRITPGALSIFRGHTALHRVTRVEGSATRLVAVLAFNREAGVTNSEEVRECFWGRRQPLVVEE